MNREKFTKELFEAVEIVTGVTEQQIKSRTKAGAIPDARKIIINILRTNKDKFEKKASWRSIGLEVGYEGCGPHSCAITMNKKALNYLDVDPEFQKDYKKVLIMRHFISKLKRIDGQRVRNWKVNIQGGAFVVSVCNGKNDYIHAPKIKAPKGFEILRSSVLEINGRQTIFRYVLNCKN